MTLSDARSHPWLRNYKPMYTEAQRRAMTRSLSPDTTSVNASMMSAMDDDSFPSPIEGGDAGVSQSLQQMKLDLIYAHDDAAMADTTGASVTPQPDNANRIRREGSRTAPLQRRSHVLSQVADGEGGVVPEPSWEMIQNAATAHDDAERTPFRGNKRMHSELTPLPEEMEGDAFMTGAHTPLGDANGVSSSPAKKRGKGAEDGSSGRGSVRGRGKTGAASAPPPSRSQRTRAGAQSAQKEDAMSEDDAGTGTKPRRSGRQMTQKVARRA